MRLAKLTFTPRTRSRGHILATVILAATAIGVVTDVAIAATVVISGTHSASSIKAACDGAGGVFQSGSSGYFCHAEKGSVTCDLKGKCTGNCGNCAATPGASRGTIEGTLRSPVGGVAVKQVTSTPTKPTAGPVRVNQPVTVSKPEGDHPNPEGNHPIGGAAKK